jgi:23S rRNA G2445 N2-methylase RlmL
LNKPDFFTNPESLEFHASCTNGLHDLLLDEADSFNLQIISSNRGGLHFKGKKNELLNFILSSRFSSRISFAWKKWRVEDAEDLYDKAVRLPWELIIPKENSFRIESFTKDSLSDSRYALYKLKDAIRDRIRDSENREALIERDDPDIEFLLRSHFDFVDLQISITPKALNKRGYRLETNEAPLRENLAQALLAFSGWKPGIPLVDPMCGAGTILIEAALYSKLLGQINRNLLEKSYIFKSLFGDLPELKSIPNESQVFLGYDTDSTSLERARRNAERAGLGDIIKFSRCDIADLKNETSANSGLVLTNPPYGVRMGNKEDLKTYYGKVSEVIKKEFSGFGFGIIAGDKSLLGYLRLKSERELNLSIAKLKGKLVYYQIK